MSDIADVAAAIILGTDFSALARLAEKANTVVKTISTPAAVVEGQASLVFTVTLSGATTTPDAFVYTLEGTGLNPMPTNGYGVPTFSNGVAAANGLIVVPVGVSTFTVTVPTSVVGYYTTPKDLTLTISDKFATGQIQSVPETIVPWASSGFGFVGDGVADDTAAFEAAMASPMSIDFTGCKIRLTRFSTPVKTTNAYGLSGRWLADASGTTWTTETRLKTFTDYNGVLKTISVACAKVNVLGTHKAEIILDNSTGLWDVGAYKITTTISGGGSIPVMNGSAAMWCIVPIIDGVDYPFASHSTNEQVAITAANSQIALSWAAFVPYSGTVTGYKVYGRGGYLGTTAAGTRTFTDNGSITPTGTRPLCQANGIYLKGNYYGWEFRGFKVSVKWPSNPARSQESRFGTGFDPNYNWTSRLHFGWGGIFDIVGMQASDNFFDWGDSLTATVFGMTVAGSHTTPCRQKDIWMHHNYFKSNNCLEFLDRSSNSDVAYNAKTIANVVVEDNDFEGQGQCGYPVITNYVGTNYKWRMGVSLDGAARTKGMTLQRNRFWNMDYTAFEVVWSGNVGETDLDLDFNANNNLIDACSGIPFTFNNAGGNTVTRSKAYNFTMHHNYFGNGLEPTLFNSVRDSTIDSNIFERTSATAVDGTAYSKFLYGWQNIYNMTITNNYFGDMYSGAGYVSGMNFADGNLFSGNYVIAKNAHSMSAMGANNQLIDNVFNYDIAGSAQYSAMLMLGSASAYASGFNNTIRNKVYIPAAQAGNAKLIYDFTTGSAANIRDTSTMYAGGSLLTQFPKTIVTWTGALVDLSVGNWHLADNFTLSGAATAAWECKLPGAQGNRTITNVSGQACTISCQSSATKYTIPNGQTKTINVASDYAVTVVA